MCLKVDGSGRDAQCCAGVVLRPHSRSIFFSSVLATDLFRHSVYVCSFLRYQYNSTLPKNARGKLPSCQCLQSTLLAVDTLKNRRCFLFQKSEFEKEF